MMVVLHTVLSDSHIYILGSASFPQFFLLKPMLSLAAKMHPWLHTSTLTLYREGDFTLLKVLNE